MWAECCSVHFRVQFTSHRGLTDLSSHDIQTTDDAVDSHCYTHYDGEPTSPDMSLLRYDDGRVEVVYDPRSNAMYSLLSAMFGISAAGGFDYDDDGIWDSDDFSGPEM